ncbi:MAG: ABC transporter ATP-binding protein [Oscillospiraceae bacterium]|nr:ABC transporter ATP-binding protein [Oscillospiraceae bacterium]
MKISKLTKNFERFSLFVDEMELVPGKIYGIIGPNGCGKTTAMKLIAGLIKPDSGQIDRCGLTERDITMAFRKPYLIRDTVVRNLTYPLTIRGIQPDERQIKESLSLAGLWDYRDSFAPGLSSGEQQKLSLLRAMIFSPKLMLIDEAFSNLDMESAGLFERMILERQQTNPATYLICAHQLSHIQRLCAYIFFMHKGKIEARGQAEDILYAPQNPHLKNYLKYASLREEAPGWNS